MLQKLNKILEKMMPLITPTGVILGIIFSVIMKDFSFLIPWLFAFMTFEGSLSMNFKSIQGAILHPFPVIIILCFLHIFMPLWAWLVGHIVFSGDSLTITGFLLGMVIPTGITSFVWVALKNGNTALTLAVILIDALLSPFIVPFSLSLLVGEKVEMDVTSMMIGLIFMIVLPSLAGILLNQLTKGKIHKELKPILSPFSKIFLGIVVMLNGAEVAPFFQNFDVKVLYIILIALFISAAGYLFAYLFGKLLKFDQGTVVAFTLTGGMRNISSGAVIAISYFPSAVALPVVVAMLFQQTLASIAAALLDKSHKQSITRTNRVGA